MARVVLTSGGVSAASHPTGNLQSEIGLRSDQRLLVDATGPDGSTCVDLSFAGYAEYPVLGFTASGDSEMTGWVILVGYSSAGNSNDDEALEQQTMRWVETFGPPPPYLIIEDGRNFEFELVGVENRLPVSDVGGEVLLPFSTRESPTPTEEAPDGLWTVSDVEQIVQSLSGAPTQSFFSVPCQGADPTAATAVATSAEVDDGPPDVAVYVSLFSTQSEADAELARLVEISRGCPDRVEYSSFVLTGFQVESESPLIISYVLDFGTGSQDPPTREQYYVSRNAVVGVTIAGASDIAAVEVVLPPG